MKHHELLFSKTESGMRGIIKIINYIRSSLSITFDHPLWTIDADYVPTESLPNFTKASIILHQECKYMMTEIVFLLRFIKYCAFSPSINNIETMKKLDKLNADLSTLLIVFVTFDVRIKVKVDTV